MKTVLLPNRVFDRYFKGIEHGEMARIEKSVVQIRNPKTGAYLKVDRISGRIMTSRKCTSYKGIPIVWRRAKCQKIAQAS